MNFSAFTRRNPRAMVRSSLGLATLAGIACVVFISLDPAEYFSHEVEHMEMDRQVWEQSVWKWPWQGVLITGLSMVLEAGLVYYTLFGGRPRQRWVRGLIGVVILIPWLASWMLLVSLGTTFIFWHYLWLLGVALLIGSVTVIASVQAILFRRSASSGTSPGHGQDPSP